MSKPTGKLLFAYSTITALNERIAELEKGKDSDWSTMKNMSLAIALAQEWIAEKDCKIAELENLINTQVFPSSGDGFSSEYIKGYEEALGDLDKILKEQGK